MGEKSMENMMNKELEEKINKAESLDDVVNACAEHGFHVTKEQLEKAIEMAEKEDLSEEDLDDVSGGFFFTIVAACMASAGLTSFMRYWGKRSRKSRR